MGKLGRDLMDWHINYEAIEPYPLDRTDLPPDDKANPPKLKADKAKGTIQIDRLTTLSGIPDRLGLQTWQPQRDRMGLGSTQRKNAQRSHHSRIVQHLSLCRLQRTGDRFDPARLHR